VDSVVRQLERQAFSGDLDAQTNLLHWQSRLGASEPKIWLLELEFWRTNYKNVTNFKRELCFAEFLSLLIQKILDRPEDTSEVYSGALLVPYKKKIIHFHSLSLEATTIHRILTREREGLQQEMKKWLSNKSWYWRKKVYGGKENQERTKIAVEQLLLMLTKIEKWSTQMLFQGPTGPQG
jgi:hypothetical protein